MRKYYRGKIVKFATGAVQFVRNKEAGKDFILITGRHGDLYVPVKQLEKALEDQWNADNEERSLRNYLDRPRDAFEKMKDAGYP